MWRRPWRMRRRLKGGMRGGRDGCTFFKDRYIDFWCGFGVDLWTPDEMIWWLWSRMRGLNYSLLVTVVAPKKMWFFLDDGLGIGKDLYIFFFFLLCSHKKKDEWTRITKGIMQNVIPQRLRWELVYQNVTPSYLDFLGNAHPLSLWLIWEIVSVLYFEMMTCIATHNEHETRPIVTENEYERNNVTPKVPE
jgi:hypothetical protein